MKFKVYRLCRDNKKIKELREQELKYSLPESIYMSEIDLYSFINKVIKERFPRIGEEFGYKIKDFNYFKHKGKFVMKVVFSK